MAGLAERVREVAFEETAQGETWAWDRLVSRPDRDVNEMEYVSRFWGYIYGLAYAFARSEDPAGANDVLAKQAHEAACEVFNDDLLHGMDLIRALEAAKAATDAVAA